jgi:hypothetical protein
MKKITYCYAIIMALLLYGCQKDIYEDALQQQNKRFRFNYLQGAPALNITNVLANKLKKSKFNSGKGINQRGLELLELGIVKYDVVMETIDEKGNITYTFRDDHPDATASKFFNMVLQEKINGDSMIKLLEYQMTPEFAAKYNSGEKEI